MAKSKETTTKFKVDISELKSNLQEANRQIALANSEFKVATAGMDKWSDSADGLTAKITQLKTVNESYSTILSDYEKKLAEIVQSEGENSEAAQNMQIRMNSLKAAIKGNEFEIAKHNNTLDEMGKAAEEAARQAEELANTEEETVSAFDNLSGEVKQQESDLKTLKKEYSSAVLEYGQFSDEAKAAAEKVSDLSSELDENRKKLKEAETAANDFDNTLAKAEETETQTVSAFDKLSNEIKQQESDLKSLRQEHANAVIKYGEESDEAKRLGAEISNLSDDLKKNKDYLKSSESAADAFDNTLDETGDSAKKAEKSLDDANKEIKDTGDEAEKSGGKLKEFLGSLGKAALTGLGMALTGLGAGLVAATEGSKEFNDNMAKLNSAAESAGISSEKAGKMFEDMYGVLGDETAANTTVSNFMAMGTSTENLNSLLNSSAGIWAKYGDSIPLDGLAESVNETAKVGQVTGNLADALNWAGENEDDFNAKLAACGDEQQRQQLIVDTLDGLYGDLGEPSTRKITRLLWT